jgi:hypothetical protein
VLWGATRAAAEARCRVVSGLSMLSAGTPMFFMGEEIVAQKLCKFNNILQARENLIGIQTPTSRIASCLFFPFRTGLPPNNDEISCEGERHVRQPAAWSAIWFSARARRRPAAGWQGA